MKLIMILKQTLTSKFQGTHWVPYAPINCVSKINGHFLCIRKQWYSDKHFLKSKVGTTLLSSATVQGMLGKACFSACTDAFKMLNFNLAIIVQSKQHLKEL